MEDLALIAYAEDRGLAPKGATVAALAEGFAAASRLAARVLSAPRSRTWGECMWTAADLSGVNQPKIITG